MKLKKPKVSTVPFYCNPVPVQCKPGDMQCMSCREYVHTGDSGYKCLRGEDDCRYKECKRYEVKLKDGVTGEFMTITVPDWLMQWIPNGLNP